MEEGTWALGNWSSDVEEPGGWHESGQGAMLGTAWETEGLQTLGIVVIVCASLKLLHLLGLISFSEGKGRYEFTHWSSVYLVYMEFNKRKITVFS